MSLDGEVFLLLEHTKGSKIVKIVPEIAAGKELAEFLVRLQPQLLEL